MPPKAGLCAGILDMIDSAGAVLDTAGGGFFAHTPHAVADT